LTPLFFDPSFFLEKKHNNINCEYRPKVDQKLFVDTKLVLIKALKIINDENHVNYDLFEYYALNEKYNSLDEIVDVEVIELIPVETDHLSCINDDKVLENILAKLDD